MKLRKKWAAGLVTLLSVTTLAACSSTDNANKDIVTMKGDTIKITDFYNEAKTTSAAQQSMLTLIMSKVFEEQYGDKVSDKKVTEAYNKTAESYGDSFSAALAQAGMTVESYKQQIRTTMLVEYAVEQAAKKELTTENYKAAYTEYNPEVTAQIIKLDSEDKAKEVLEKAKADGADFSKLAKENSTDSATKDKGGEVKFDSASTDVPADVMSAAFKLKEGEVSDVVTVVDTSTYTTSYYIVKLTKAGEKDTDWKTYKSQLKKIIMNEKTSDTNFQNTVIAAALKKANVKIKDDAFSSILSQYTTTSSSSSSSSSASSASSSETSSSSTEASSTTESSSSAE